MSIYVCISAASRVMSAIKSGSSLRALVLTPERIPSFFVPSRSPLLASPLLRRSSPDGRRLLSDHDDDTSEASPSKSPTSPAASPRFLLRLPPPRIGRHRRAAADAPEFADAGVKARGVTSLLRLPKVTKQRGLRDGLSASPTTSRRESLFVQNKPVKITVTDADEQDPVGTSAPVPGRSRVTLRPVIAVGLKMMKELKKPATALKSSVSPRMTALH